MDEGMNYSYLQLASIKVMFNYVIQLPAQAEII